ncbi:MAG: FadR family transcriptional regulator [Spirochaetes bacterium]|nr:FadR family transcriptional regulator [Spirochaetota bacterium]
MNLTQDIVRRLEKDILGGDYPPGSRFPSEREIAAKYGISRATARETVKSLSQLGLLATRPQSGSVVSDYESEASLDLLIHIMKHREVDTGIILPLMEFRKVVEVHAAGSAAEKAGEDDIAPLDEIVSREREAGITPEDMTTCDYELHLALVRLSGNLVIKLVFNSFRPVYRMYTELFFGLSGAIETTVEQHGRLVDAIRLKDADAARRVMAEALDYGERRVRESLGIGAGR